MVQLHQGLFANFAKRKLQQGVFEAPISVQATTDSDSDSDRDLGAEGQDMIGSSGMRVMMATRPLDFRKGMDGLAAMVRIR